MGKQDCKECASRWTGICDHHYRMLAYATAVQEGVQREARSERERTMEEIVSRLRKDPVADEAIRFLLHRLDRIDAAESVAAEKAYRVAENVYGRRHNNPETMWNIHTYHALQEIFGGHSLVPFLHEEMRLFEGVAP